MATGRPRGRPRIHPLPLLEAPVPDILSVPDEPMLVAMREQTAELRAIRALLRRFVETYVVCEVAEGA